MLGQRVITALVLLALLLPALFAANPWPFVGLMTTSGSTSPVGRMICSTISVLALSS